MSALPICPSCAFEHTYQDGDFLVCPGCAHEWSPDEATVGNSDETVEIRDAHGTPLQDGDDVHLIKDLRVKGSSTTLKKGAKARGIRIIAGDHEISCRIDGVSYELKAEFLKKA
ncbi:MAG TPA: alkylphosphonate utilization protein [Candidatus Paenalcaligenes intestinipullorum]|uniref:Alkylphosphonate utilization protein n=1 Tax=Candidatus Paenalcaligenes intestinipullorum TaxID=2838718 RepID=A0A9D2U9A4_9BURK|nr:alkylphosphonate utilization protein [Candidatus Paenalcaligenes intestinipullorum]